MVRNQVEELVAEALNRELADNPHKYPGVCSCPSCLAYMQAEALNFVKPFYITCIAGEVYGEFRSKELQNYSDILVSIAKGIEAVLRIDPHGNQK